MILLETKQLTKTFKSRKATVEAVKGVDIHVNQGEIFGFLGPNGAGKTTVMRILSTLLEPTTGSAHIAGLDLHKQSTEIRRIIGYVSQSGGVEGNATGRENLYLQARLFSIPKVKAKERVEHLVSLLQLDSFVDRLGKTYSGGQKRRLDIALGMIHQPKLLFLDEPTTGLDPQSRAYLWEEIKKLTQQGTTVFLTTHYLEEADELCDRLSIIDQGKIVVDGTPIELKRQVTGDVIKLGFEPHTNLNQRAKAILQNQTFVKDIQTTDSEVLLHAERGEEILPVILRLLDADQIHLTSLILTHPSLDDVFFKYTGKSLREVEE